MTDDLPIGNSVVTGLSDSELRVSPCLSTHRSSLRLIVIQYSSSHFWVMKTSTVFFVIALAACQQSASATMSALSSQEPTVQTAAAPSVAPIVLAPATEEWKLPVSPGESETYRIHVTGVDGRELQVIMDRRASPLTKPPPSSNSMISRETESLTSSRAASLQVLVR